MMRTAPRSGLTACDWTRSSDKVTFAWWHGHSGMAVEWRYSGLGSVSRIDNQWVLRMWKTGGDGPRMPQKFIIAEWSGDAMPDDAEILERIDDWENRHAIRVWAGDTRGTQSSPDEREQ